MTADIHAETLRPARCHRSQPGRCRGSLALVRCRPNHLAMPDRGADRPWISGCSVARAGICGCVRSSVSTFMMSAPTAFAQNE